MNENLLKKYIRQGLFSIVILFTSFYVFVTFHTTKHPQEFKQKEINKQLPFSIHRILSFDILKKQLDTEISLTHINLSFTNNEVLSVTDGYLKFNLAKEKLPFKLLSRYNFVFDEKEGIMKYEPNHVNFIMEPNIMIAYFKKYIDPKDIEAMKKEENKFKVKNLNKIEEDNFDDILKSYILNSFLNTIQTVSKTNLLTLLNQTPVYILEEKYNKNLVSVGIKDIGLENNHNMIIELYSINMFQNSVILILFLVVFFVALEKSYSFITKRIKIVRID